MPYFLFLFGGIGVCVFTYAVFSLSFISLLLMLLGFVFPASFLSPEIQETTKHKRYRFSSLRILVNCNDIFLANRSISRLVAPHCFSFLAALLLRIFVGDSSLVFWLYGALIYEVIGRLVSFQSQLFAKVFKDQRDGLEIDSRTPSAESDF
jgi:hypothetical protein